MSYYSCEYVEASQKFASIFPVSFVIRQCNVCRLIKSVVEFSNNRLISGGLARDCLVCKQQRNKLFRLEHPMSSADRQVKSAYAIEYYHRVRDAVLDGYGGRCACCGDTHREFLTLDHVNGGGNKHRQKVRTLGVYQDALSRNFPSDYQILCFNCNCAKEFSGICPHQIERNNL